MAIEIEAPDGSIVEFPVGTPDTVIRTAMLKAYPPLKGADYAKGLARTVGQGVSLGFGDEITAGVRAGVGALTGDGSFGDLYDQKLDEERKSIDTFAQQNPGTALAANIGGAIATAPIAPMATFVRGVGALRTGANAAANAAGYGAVAGFGAGEGGLENRIENAATTGGGSAAIAGPLGAAVGRIGAKATPDAEAAMLASRNQQIANAADRLGVEVPRAAATNPTIAGNAARGTAGAIQAMPVIGAPLQRASQQSMEAIQGLGDDIANQYAVGVTKDSAGQAVKDAGKDWISGKAKAVSSRLYDEVGKKLQIPNGKVSLPRTEQTVQRLLARDAEAASDVNAGAVEFVREALSRPSGLTYQGLRELRTNIGAMLDDGLLPNAGTTKPALKRLYASLTDDLTDGVKALGGPDALKAWEKANSMQRGIAERREQLAKVIGRNDAAKSPESIVETLIGMASGKSGRADAQRLVAARKAVGPEAWDELSSEAVRKLGMVEGKFNPVKFLKSYQDLSDNGRQILFSSTGKGNLKAALDDLATVSNAYRDMQNAVARGSAPTNTALALGGFGYGAGVLPALALALKGNLFARIMAQPVRVRQVTELQRAMMRVAQGDNPNVAKTALIGLAQGIAQDEGGDPREWMGKLQEAMKEL